MPDIITKLLQDSKLEIDSTRRAEIEKRLNIYHDNYKKILENEVDNQFHKDNRDNVKQMIDDSSNLLKRIVDEISIVYQKQATRTYKINEKDNQNYQDVMSKIAMDITMEEVNRMTTLCNESLVYIVPRNKQIEYDIITPDQVEVFQDEDDPTKPVAILYTKTYVDSVDNIDIQKVYWDIYGNHKIMDKNDRVMEELGNPYNNPDKPGETILPFVIFHRKKPKDSIWDRTGGTDLLSATLQIGVLLTYLNYLIKVGSFKMLTFTGIDIKDLPQSLVFDPLSPKVVKDPAGQVGTVDFQIALDKIWEIIYSKIGAIANNYGLSLDNFKLSADAQSGYALRIKNLGLEKVVENQKKHYRYYENELFKKTMIVNNTMMKKNKIPEKGIFKVDFAEIEYPEDPSNIRKQWKFDIGMGAKNIYDYLRFVNPDIKDDKQAEAVLAQNVEINNKVEEDYGVSIDKLLEQAFKDDEEVVK